MPQLPARHQAATEAAPRKPEALGTWGPRLATCCVIVLQAQRPIPRPRRLCARARGCAALHVCVDRKSVV